MAIQQEQLNFHFPSTNGGIAQGGNDPAAEFFEGIESVAVVRESLQNIIDAKDPNKKTAKASFRLLYMKPKDMPGVAGLVQKYDQCINATPDKKIKKRFEHAKQLILNNKEIPVLKISDYETVGLYGDDKDRKGNYYNFMKAIGSTSKSGSGNGGSFGIGKAAYLAASTMKVKFVSSIYMRDLHKEYVFQGKASLISHEENSHGDEKQGTGFLGLPNEPYPIRNKEEIPKIFLRDADELGTDIYIVGYEEDADWEQSIQKSVLTHFWMAIDKGDVAVSVGERDIDNNNLQEMLHDFYYDDMATKENPLPYYLAYKQGRMHEKKSEVLGVMRLYALKNDYPCGIAYFRTTGMRIEIKHKNETNGIAYVFACEDEKGNALLRDMEPPSHDKWTASRAEDEAGKTRVEARTAMDEIKNFIKSIVDKENGENQKKFETIPGIEKFFTRQQNNLPGNGSELPKSEDASEGVKDSQSFEKHKKTKGKALTSAPKPYKALNEPSLSDVGGAGGGEDGGGGGGDDVVKDGSGAKPVGTGKLSPLGIVTIRAFAKRDSDKNEIWHTVVVHSKPNTNIAVKIYVIAEDGPFSEIGVCNVREFGNDKDLEIVGKNLIKGLQTSDDGVVKIFVLFDDKVVRHAIQVNAYENR